MTRDMPSPFCAAVDWGTSSFRLWLLAADGAVLGERRSQEGMMSAGATGFGAVLDGHLSILQAPADLPVIVCGMAGARQGWIEAPYVDAPANLADIAKGAVAVPGISRDVRILPGIAQRGAGDSDVMRGEETQVMGLALPGAALLCLPGTHSKWISLSQGRIERFSTFMTGEIFALLSEHSILRHSIGAKAEVLAERDAFETGVAASLADPAAILHRLFSLRAEGLFGAGTPEKARARLSGLLVGIEIAGARSLHEGRRDIILVASDPLLAVYRSALAVAGYRAEEVDADRGVRQGLLAAARYCFIPSGR